MRLVNGVVLISITCFLIGCFDFLNPNKEDKDSETDQTNIITNQTNVITVTNQNTVTNTQSTNYTNTNVITYTNTDNQTNITNVTNINATNQTNIITNQTNVTNANTTNQTNITNINITNQTNVITNQTNIVSVTNTTNEMVITGTNYSNIQLGLAQFNLQLEMGVNPNLTTQEKAKYRLAVSNIRNSLIAVARRQLDSSDVSIKEITAIQEVLQGTNLVLTIPYSKNSYILINRQGQNVTSNLIFQWEWKQGKPF